jgi:chromosome segregation ATPase
MKVVTTLRTKGYKENAKRNADRKEIGAHKHFQNDCASKIDGLKNDLERQKLDLEAREQEFSKLKNTLSKLIAENTGLKNKLDGRIKQDTNQPQSAKSSNIGCKETKCEIGYKEKTTTAKSRLRTAVQEAIDSQSQARRSGVETKSPRRQLYVGNIAFGATSDDVDKAVKAALGLHVDNVTMPRLGDRHCGYAFDTIAWPFELEANHVVISTIYEAIFRINTKGRPIYAKEARSQGR